LFLGLANLKQRWVDHFAESAAPLNELTSKKAEWKWDQEQQDTFDELKRRMVEKPLFVHASPYPNALSGTNMQVSTQRKISKPRL